MANNGIEDILIGESYKSTKKSGGHPVVFLIILLMIAGAFAAWYYYTNRVVIDEKMQFANGFLSASTIKLNDKDFYSKIIDRVLDENSEMNTNITVSSTKKIESLQGIDVNNFDFELMSQNNFKEKNFYNELLVKYSGNNFLKVQNLVNGNKFAVISDEIVNKYVGVKAQNYKNIFEDSNLDLEFIYELINAEKIDLSDDEIKKYFETYYNKIYDQIPNEKFTQKDNIVITQNNNYIDVTAYELNLSQNELNDIIVNVLTGIKSDTNLLNSIVSKNTVKLDLQGNVTEEESDESQNELENENQDEIDSQYEEENQEESENQEEELEVRDDGRTLQLVPVSQVNFQTADEINLEDENEEERIEENYEQDEEENLEDDENNEENEEFEEFGEERIEQPEGLSLNTNDEELMTVKTDFTIEDFIKILLGRKINIPKEKIIEKIDDYIENLDDGNGLIVTIYVSAEKTEKMSITLPNENKIDIQFLANTDKENSAEITYLTKESNYKDGIGFSISEVHNSANYSIKLVKSYIENEKINKKVSLSVKTDGTKNSNSISNDIVITSSTNSDETKFVAENKIKFINSNLLIDKLTNSNSVFLDDLSVEEREATIEAIKEKIDIVLEEKKEDMNLIDLNSGTSIVNSNLNNLTSNNRPLVKKALENKINILRNEASENNEEFNIESLLELTIDGFDVTINLEEDRVIVDVNSYKFIVDSEFNVEDTE